jgi:DEAD/DEAH box helicase domain-containing protein
MSRNSAAVLPAGAALGGLVKELRRDPRLGAQIAHAAFLPAQPARYGELDPPLPERLSSALARGGVARLWSHQTEGLAAARRRQDVLITTPTASGKSLVFQLPALEAAAAGASGRGLFLFPLKALGQDQRGKLRQLAAEAGLDADQAGCEIYDGDTPPARRAAIRKRLPRVLISNPDMLHLAILGHWTLWGPLLADLSWIVLDELHTYRGIFGSHFHHVLWRLLRLCRSVGGDPVLIASSATAANAGEFAAQLTGREFHWIAESGAPREGRHLLLVRPAASPYTAALRLFVRCLDAGLKTIVFTKARRITELLYSWLRHQEPELASRVASYRAGFLPEERRQVERALFAGTLDGVISTSALEMGIDVGGLDACILVGYPGSMMATWQRSGRVGRHGRESITVMVAMPDALDQYFLDHPEQFLERPCERLVVDPTNQPVARGHLVCAAAEMPLAPRQDAPYLERHRASLEGLLRQGHLLQAAPPRTAAPTAPTLAAAAPATTPVSLPSPMASETSAAPETSAVPVASETLVASEPSIAPVAFDTSAAPVASETPAASAAPEAAAEAGEIFCLRRHPQRLLNLRGTGNTFGIFARQPADRPAGGDGEPGERLIGTIDGVRALHECHPGAVYLHAGRQYLVEALEREERRVRAVAAELDYFTTPLTEKQTEILEVLRPPAGSADAPAGHPLAAFLGRLKVTEWVVGFERKRVFGQETIDQTPLDLPPVEFETVGLWWQAPRHFEETLRRAGEHFLGALHASEHAAISLFPLLALCDRGDIGGISYPFHPQVGCGAVFIYDGHPGGVGITARGYEDLAGLLDRVLQLIAACPCERGCPSCIQSPRCGNGNRPLDKAGALRVLRLLLGQEQPAVPPVPPVAVAGAPPVAAIDALASAVPAALPALPVPAAGPRLLLTAPLLRLAIEPPPSSATAAAVPVEPPGPTFDASTAALDAGRQHARIPVAWAWPALPFPESGPVPDAAAPPRGLSPEQWRRHRELPRTVLFDVETLRAAAEVGGFGNCHRMGVAIAVACFLEEGSFASFGERQVHELAAALRQATLVVGFNVKRFDYAVLAGYTGEDYCRTLPTLDLLEDIHTRLGFRVGLGRLALDTLGLGKSADGLQSLAWVKEGRLDLVESYCRRDVEILRDLYLHGRREGCLFYHDQRRDVRLRLAVEW